MHYDNFNQLELYEGETMNRIELKQKAKAVIQQDFWRIIGFVFLVTIISSISQSIGSYTLIGLFFISNVVTIGMWYFYFNMAYQKEFSASDMFKGFSGLQYMTIVKKMALYVLYTTLWTLFGIITFGIGFIWAIPKMIGYSMVPYLLVKEDCIEKTANEVIQKSSQLLHGYKMEYFMLLLSFIGWYLLSIITFGIVGLYTAPFTSITVIYYFDELYLNSSETEVYPE